MEIWCPGKNEQLRQDWVARAGHQEESKDGVAGLRQQGKIVREWVFHLSASLSQMHTRPFTGDSKAMTVMKR